MSSATHAPAAADVEAALSRILENGGVDKQRLPQFVKAIAGSPQCRSTSTAPVP